MDRTRCCACARPLTPDDLVVQVWEVARVAHDSRFGRTADVDTVFGYAHKRCAAPRDFAPGPYRPRILLTPAEVDVPEITVPEYICALCGKTYAPGDKIVIVFRIVGIRRDPQLDALGAACCEGYETAHHTCSDPNLQAARAPLVVSTHD